jgi:hypothetical protein
MDGQVMSINSLASALEAQAIGDEQATFLYGAESVKQAYDIIQGRHYVGSHY